MTASSVQSAYLVPPVARCVCSVQPRDAYDAPPGAAPFYRFLEANRLARPPSNLDVFEPSTIEQPPQGAPSTPNQKMSTPLLPKLGELLDSEPRPQLAGQETRLFQQFVPATGRVLDIYA